MYGVVSFIIAFAITINCAALSQEKPAVGKEPTAKGSLSDIRDKHRVWLIVRRSSLLDASGSAESVLNEIYNEQSARQNYPRTYNLIAKKLNKYMRKHGSITAARSFTEAEFILCFNVLEVRRPLGTPYAYGELFVILNEASTPRILWKTRSSGMFADDAVDAFLEDLKATRGEY